MVTRNVGWPSTQWPPHNKSDGLHGIDAWRKIGPGGKRRYEFSNDGALGPKMRIRYDLLRHTPPSKIITRLRSTMSPLRDLSATIAVGPCVLDGPRGLTHTRIGLAMDQLQLTDPRSDGPSTRKIFDIHDAIRIQGHPACYWGPSNPTRRHD